MKTVKTVITTSVEPMDENAMLYAAYMAHGLRELGRSSNRYQQVLNVLNNYGTSHLTMVENMNSHIPYLMALEKAAVSFGAEYRGVFPYEVVEDFGNWWGLFMIGASDDPESGDMPTERICQRKLLDMVHKFFGSQFGPNEEPGSYEDLRKHLEAVPTDAREVTSEIELKKAA